MKINNKTMIIAIVAAIILLFISLFTGNKKTEANTPVVSSDYKTITEVAGVSFMINENIANKATAISEISEKINVEPNLYYVYKDGGTNYLLFCLDSIIVAVEKGTSFNFDNYEKKEDAIPTSSVAGLWFEVNGNKFVYEENDSSFNAYVNAGLVITNDIYNDYVGQLVVISDGETEWSIFAGVPGTSKFKDLPDGTKEGIEAITQSLKFSSHEVINTDEQYAVVIGTGETEKVETGIKEEPVMAGNDEPSEESEIITEIIETEPDVSGNDIEETPAQSFDQLPVEDKDTESQDTDTEKEDTDTETEKTDTESQDTDTEKEDTDTENQDTVIKKEDDNNNIISSGQNNEPKKSVYMQNQNHIKNKSQNKAYSSDIYSMLSLGDNGIITEYDLTTKETVNPIINISKVYTGTSAEQMIKDYCNRTGVYNYFEAPEGCSWQLAEYYLSYQNCVSEPYINIKLKGIDGKNLRFRGIVYSQRTYDIKDKAVTLDNFAGPYYCYYAVPNGCHEYSLECGTGIYDSDIAENSAAYYLIN